MLSVVCLRGLLQQVFPVVLGAPPKKLNSRLLNPPVGRSRYVNNILEDTFVMGDHGG